MAIELLALRAFLDYLPQGLLVVADSGEIRIHNMPATQMLGLDSTGIEQGGMAALPESSGLIASWRNLLDFEHGKEAVSFSRAGKSYSANLSRENTGVFEEPWTLIQISDVTESRKLDRLRTGLINDVIHPLKGPLTSINTSLALLASEKYVTMQPPARELVKLSSAEIQRLGSLLDDATDLIALETGTAAPNLYFESIDLRVLPTNAVDTCRNGWNATGFASQLIIPDQISLEISGDYEKIRMILSRLFTFVIPFGCPATKLTVGVEEAGAHLQIRIESEMLTTAERMALGDPKSFVGVGGATGNELGLNIAKGYAELLGASIELTSDISGNHKAILRLRRA